METLMFRLLDTVMREDGESYYGRSLLRRRPMQAVEEVFDMMKDPSTDCVTPTTMFDFFTYRGAEVSDSAVVVFFRFYAADGSQLSYKEFEYFLKFQRGYYSPTAEVSEDSLSHKSGSSVYFETEDVVLELILRELLLFELLYEMSVGLEVNGGLDKNIQRMYRLLVPVIQIDLKEDDVVRFMRRFTSDETVEFHVRHVMARFDVSNDWVVSFSDFSQFIHKISLPATGEIRDSDYLSARVTRSTSRSWNRKSKFGQPDCDKSGAYSLLYCSNSRKSRPPSVAGQPKFVSSKLTNSSYFTDGDMDEDKKQSLTLKKRLNHSGHLLDDNCENDIGALTLAETKDILRKYVKLLVDFDRLNQIVSLREEVCLKEVYLMLLNLKNPTYDRTLNPFKYSVLFSVLDINLTEE